MERLLERALQTNGTGRVDWVDYGKGFCIVLVVMMHSTLGVGNAVGEEGWLHHVVAFAKPFRMPDFFLISGLFLARVIDRDWETFIDRKVYHFTYFYTLWVTIQLAFKLPPVVAEQGLMAALTIYLEAFIEPFGTLWFIYLLPVFFVVTKLVRNVSPVIVWLAAAALEIAPIETGSLMVDEFASRFVYFYTGYVLAGPIFAFAAKVQTNRLAAVAGLLLWGGFNLAAVRSGYSELPGISLALGMLGVAAVVAFAATLAKGDLLPPLRYFGENSLVIYLAFFLPMVIARVALVKTHIITDVGTMSLLITASGILGALMLYWAVRNTPLKFLFVRPELFKFEPRKPAAMLQPAE